MTTSPYEPPEAHINAPLEFQYVGFWARVLASLIDGILWSAIAYPLIFLIYGSEYWFGDQIFLFWDVVINWIVPLILTLFFWFNWGATPGKMALGARIVDADTGSKPSIGQLVGRYLSYLISMLGLFLGYFWVGWDPRKQGWHDKLAGTVVVRPLPQAGV